MHVPDDLAELDLPMKAITRIIEIREKGKEALRILRPSETVKALATARVQWAKDAELAVKAGEEEPDWPTNRKAKE